MFSIRRPSRPSGWCSVGKHSHPLPPPPCSHSLFYCEKCDVVECTLCGKEWKWESPFLKNFYLQRQDKKKWLGEMEKLEQFPPTRPFISGIMGQTSPTYTHDAHL